MFPADAYYGIQTARAVENYPISGMRAHPTLIRAIAMEKQAAAEANLALKLLQPKVAEAIIAGGAKKCRTESGTSSSSWMSSRPVPASAFT